MISYLLAASAVLVFLLGMSLVISVTLFLVVSKILKQVAISKRAFAASAVFPCTIAFLGFLDSLAEQETGGPAAQATAFIFISVVFAAIVLWPAGYYLNLRLAKWRRL